MIRLEQVQVTFNSTSNSSDKASNKTNQTCLAFDLSIATAEKVAIIGASGSGKSTLLNLIAGFVFADNDAKGHLAHHKVILDNTDHTQTQPYQRPVSMLFQDNNLFNHLSIADNIGLGLKPNLKLSIQDKQQIHQVATQVGLSDMLNRKPHQLSGGQQQRVALARCLLRDKPILLLDEPFSALDKGLRTEMLSLLIQLSNHKDLTLVIVTHQPEELEGFVDRMIDISDAQQQ